MASSFPTSLDTLSDPASTDSQRTKPTGVGHAGLHKKVNDAIESVQAKVGIDGSVVTTSHAYKISTLETQTGALSASAISLAANSGLSTRVSNLETTTNSVTGAATALTTRVSNLETTTNTATGNIAALTTKVGYITAPNPVRNASFQVAQRGTSVAVGADIVMTLDGWWGYRTGSVAGMTVSQQTTLTDTQGSGYCARIQRDNANASTAALSFVQSMPTVDSRRFAGRQITFSFRARKGALYSAASDALAIALVTGTGTDQSFVSAYTGSVTLISTSVTLTTAWQTFTVTATVAANVTEMTVAFSATPVGTAGATDYFEIKDVRIDEGPYAQKHVPLPYAADLADAMYYLRYFSAVGNSCVMLPFPWRECAAIYASNAIVGILDGPMRSIPTCTIVGSWTVTDGHAGNQLSTLSAAPVVSQSSDRGFFMYCYTSSALTSKLMYFVMAASDTTARMIFSAEI